MSESSTVTVPTRDQGPGCLIRILYFIFVGLWLGGIVTIAAWVLNITIIGLPLGLWLLNRLPQIMTLKPAPIQGKVTIVDGKVIYRQSTLPARPFLLRALYFLLIGWLFSLIWSLLAWLLSISIVGLPFGVWMFNRLPGVTTLMRH